MRPHSHSDSAWSGVYYVDSGSEDPSRPLSGILEFLDPRAGTEAVSAPGDPYGEHFRVRPQAGLLVLFPSWLYHWVHPYAGERSRIAISFNAAIGAHAAEQAQGSEEIVSSEASDIATQSPATSASRLRYRRACLALAGLLNACCPIFTSEAAFEKVLRRPTLRLDKLCSR
jgi:hypothetical protein